MLGTVYDYKQNIAKAIIATKLCELEPIKGSKYIQSKVDEAFISLKEDCLQNYDAKYIVFGTPCQLVGLTNILEKEKIKNEIIKIDLFCHGVPSYHLWQAYRKWIKEKYGIETLEHINFRSKHIGWHDFCMEIHAGNHHYYRSSEGDYFYKAFFDNIVLQQACLTCEARMNRSDADIRLGDYWGKRYIHNQKGISAVLVLTETGRQWMEQLAKDRVEVLEETSVQDCIQAQSVEPYSYQKLNIDTLANIQTAKNIQQLIKQYRKKMSKKYRVKKALKESTAWMPDTWRSQIRRLSHKIR